MTCPRCRTPAADGARFCAACGAPLGSTPSAMPGGSDPTSLGPSPLPAGSEPTELSPERPASPHARPPTPSGASSGWLHSSGAIDHGRFSPGTIFENRYRIVGLLGRGGMGEVYRADDLRLGQPVALKFLPLGLAQDPTRLAQFHNEVRTARQVSHANVCRVYDIGDVSGQLYLSMEYVDGEDLASLLRRIGRLPEDKALEIARQLCAGLAAAHERGVLHRDLKPANVMLDGTGRVRIMDFSLAATGEVTDIRSGTPAYMAPEQLEGREVTAKSDIYALGLVLYELFTGRRAFDAKDLNDLIEQQQSGSITAPTSLVKTLDPSIERAILRCLERDPARRPATALAVAASLPGGDPLAAALAAGETPSPEMVAAVGGEAATLSPMAGIVWVALAGAFLAATVVLAQRTSLINRAPMDKSAAVLADRAEEIGRTLGYNDRVADRAFGFEYDQRFLEWADQHGSGAARWPELAANRPASLRFWYRTSPRPLVPFNPLGSPDEDDPPLLVTDMTSVVLDSLGRLVAFRAMPPEVEPADSPRSVDWSGVFQAAGLDPSTFTSVAPERTPASYADERRAWRGALPGAPAAEADVRIEAAGYRGRPVMFQIVGAWTPAARDTATAASGGGNSAFQTIMVIGLILVAAWLGRANLRSGRADRRGAFGLAGFTFCMVLALWALSVHASDLAAERGRFFASIGIALFLAGVLYLMYLALEPFLRRSWPTMLIGWSRVMSGELRDPVIGRDLLIGAMCGTVLATADLLYVLVPGMVGKPEPIPHLAEVTALLGGRFMAESALGALSNGLQSGLISVFVFALFREFVLRLLRPLNLSRGRLDLATTTLAIVIYMVLNVGDAGVNRWLLAWYIAVSGTIAVLVMLRIGLFAAIVMAVVNTLLSRAPMTLDGSRFYASTGWTAIAVVAGMCVVGFWLARADEPLFGRSGNSQLATDN